MWNNCHFSSSGLMYKCFPMCEIQTEGVMPTPTEMKRFKECLGRDESLQKEMPNHIMCMPNESAVETVFFKESSLHVWLI